MKLKGNAIGWNKRNVHFEHTIELVVNFEEDPVYAFLLFNIISDMDTQHNVVLAFLKADMAGS
ncbi:hypothetical protein D3C81_1205500 [compost metagenome]